MVVSKNSQFQSTRCHPLSYRGPRAGGPHGCQLLRQRRIMNRNSVHAAASVTGGRLGIPSENLGGDLQRASEGGVRRGSASSLEEGSSPSNLDCAMSGNGGTKTRARQERRGRKKEEGDFAGQTMGEQTQQVRYASHNVRSTNAPKAVGVHWASIDFIASSIFPASGDSGYFSGSR